LPMHALSPRPLRQIHTTSTLTRTFVRSLSLSIPPTAQNPVALLAMPPRTGAEVLAIVWTGAAAGVALKMWWPSSPRWVGIPLYLLLGYVAIWFAGTLLDGGGPIVVGLLVAGGVLYNVGAIFFGIRWPDPWPRTFGYHEFFHALTAAAATSHYVAVWFVVLRI
ncbi:MAG: hemolysin III family protein, partial [Mycobacteriaceae bacterium]|nr:hemolysin III family protein [Mycobacteriaceae bacterium]